MSKIERFVVLMYEKNSTLSSVDEDRHSQRCKTLENSPQQLMLCANIQHGQLTKVERFGALVWTKALSCRALLTGGGQRKMTHHVTPFDDSKASRRILQ